MGEELGHFEDMAVIYNVFSDAWNFADLDAWRLLNPCLGFRGRTAGTPHRRPLLPTTPSKG